MAAYKPTMSYRLIYIFTIHDAQHEGYWKIGKTNFDSVNSYKQLPPNCAELNCAARDRIDQYTKTAMVEYDLQYTELARRTVTFPDGTTDTELFDDDDVHNVLYNSGFSARKFSNSNQDSEWFEVPLSVAIRAIQAVKEGRTALTAAEKSEGQISFLPQTVPAAPKKRAITLRDEQMDCVNQTLRVFRKENSMLWNCKMRFGKTVTAYALIKKAGYQKVIVVTHRPVVEDGWRNDFDLIFGEGDNRAFLKKDRFDTDSSVYDAAMDARNDANLTAYQNSGKAFVYFASMQDLRGSQRADGKFDKNNAVFDMDWDLVIYDEAHEGTQTQRGQKVQSLLEAEKNGKAPKVLQLSGTPYNLMQKYENNVYTWDYVMEQKCKREWDTLHPGDHNPYADLPELRILTFDLGKSLPTSYRYETLEMAFNFTEFFRVWTGDPARDFRPLPAGAQVGDFVHEDDVQLFHTLSDKLSEQKAAKKETKVHINNQGLTGEEYEKADKISNKPKRERTKEDDYLLKKLQEQKKEREKVIRLLRNVSIRLPLLIYGAKVDLTESIKMADFITLVDEESWQEFMPKTVDKPLFRKLLKYYDEDVVSGAGLRIRRMAKAADELPPTERVKRIAEIFSHFRNPDKETVLTPWRVVNLHLSNMVGGYCFLNEQFDSQEVLEEPRLVDQGQVTEDIFLNPEARILEMNSKSGLYPLYMAYSLYAMKLPGPEDKLPLEQTQALWQETVEQQIFVLCKTRMAESITRRTLVGYQDWTVNTTYIPHLLERMENDPQRLAKKLQRTDTWGKEGQPMKFDAIVGNPPYQEMDGGGKGYSAKPVYNYFVGEAKAIEPHYISMITPSRWFSGGKGLDDFRAEMLQDKHLRKIVDYADNEALFSNVSIVGGVNYFLWDSSYNGDCEVTSIRGENAVTLNRDLSEYDIFIRNNNALQLIRRMEASGDRKMDDVVYPRNVFGISSDLRGQDNKDEKHQLALFSSQKSNSMAMSYISGDEVQKQHELIGKYKVIMGKVVPRGGEVGVDPSVGYRVTSTLQVLSPGSVFTDSYLLLAAFDSKTEAIHFAEYMCLKFPRFLLHETYSSMNISKQNFRFVPFLDYSKEWTDKELFKRYGCNEEEISMIESIIRPMEYVFHE